jgi:hypothetical protein
MYAGLLVLLPPYEHAGNQILQRASGLSQKTHGYPSIYLFGFI